MAIFMLARPTIFDVELHRISSGMSFRRASILRSYVAVADELTARRLERYFKSGSGKAFAKKRFLKAA
jgi:hypothetical protein